MKIVFFGNGDFGIPSLDFLFKEKNVSLLSVVTNPPKRAGRGLKARNTKIHDFCIKSKINITLNDNLNDIDFKLLLLTMAKVSQYCWFLYNLCISIVLRCIRVCDRCVAL